MPGAGKTELAGVKDGRLRIRLAAAPEDGKANAELINYLSKMFDCPKRDLRILCGEKSRFKAIALPPEYGVKVEEIVEEMKQV